MQVAISLAEEWPASNKDLEPCLNLGKKDFQGE